jgi:succinate dehydrogenase/fumarate reductase-like Fe-S protein
VPLPSGDSIPVSFQGGMDMESKMPADLTGNKTNPLADMSSISDMITEMSNIFKQSTEEPSNMTFNNTSSNKKSTTALESITDKLDTLLDRIRLNNNLQTELLDHARG